MLVEVIIVVLGVVTALVGYLFYLRTETVPASEPLSAERGPQEELAAELQKNFDDLRTALLGQSELYRAVTQELATVTQQLATVTQQLAAVKGSVGSAESALAKAISTESALSGKAVLDSVQSLGSSLSRESVSAKEAVGERIESARKDVVENIGLARDRLSAAIAEAARQHMEDNRQHMESTRQRLDAVRDGAGALLDGVVRTARETGRATEDRVTELVTTARNELTTARNELTAARNELTTAVAGARDTVIERIEEWRTCVLDRTDALRTDVVQSVRRENDQLMAVLNPAELREAMESLPAELRMALRALPGELRGDLRAELSSTLSDAQKWAERAEELYPGLKDLADEIVEHDFIVDMQNASVDLKSIKSKVQSWYTEWTVNRDYNKQILDIIHKWVITQPSLANLTKLMERNDHFLRDLARKGAKLRDNNITHSPPP